MNDSNAIQVKDLVKFYGKVQALSGVNLDVKRGEIYGFLGPNGAGKTTTIRCMLDLIRPQGGSISVLGLNPKAEPEVIKARVGYLPGELHMDENMTAKQIFRFFNHLRGNRSDWDFIEELSERLKLELKIPIKNFSKGNKQKVGIVVALMHRPELLLLDAVGVDAPFVEGDLELSNPVFYRRVHRHCVQQHAPDSTRKGCRTDVVC